MRSFLFSVAPLALAIGVVGAATAAFAAQDEPFTVNGVTAVCTGVGSSKDKPEWASYPVKIVLANTAGENVAAAHYTVTRDGQTVLEADCDAPWLLIKGAAAGNYAATASTAEGGRSNSVTFTAANGPQKELTLMFPTRQQAAR
jgi:hypothetical protein